MSNFRRHLLRQALSVAIGVGSALASVHAQSVTDKKSFHVPAQPAATALNALAEQADITLVFSQDVVSGITTRPLQGNFTTDDALRAMLEGTDLAIRRINDSTVSIGPPSEVSDVTVVAGRLLDQVSMMKRGETMRETPQSVTIMTQQRIEEQKLVSISEVLNQAPGMTVETDSYNKPSSFYSRGFEVSNVQIDGASVGVNRSYNASRNLAMYEQVEVLRGADGLFAGSGDPGGTVNLVRKRGLDRAQILFNASAGSWDNYQADLDVAGPLAFDGRLRGRVVAQWHDRDYYYDTSKSTGRFFYGTAEMDVTDDTTLIVGASWEKADETIWTQGVPRYVNGEVLRGWSRERSLVSDWNAWNQEAREFFVRLEQNIGTNWKVTLSATRDESDLYINGVGIRPVDPLTGMAGLFFPGYVYDPQTRSFDASVRGKFELLGRTHSVLLGYDGYKTKGNSWGIGSVWDDPIPQLINPLDYGPNTIPHPSRLEKTWRENPLTTQRGLYGRVQLHLAEPLKLILGGRYSSYEYSSAIWWEHNADGSLAPTPDSLLAYKESGIFTPYASALFDLNRQWTLYASVTEIHKTQAHRLAGPLPGKPLDSVTGRNYELGSKAELQGGRLGVSFALYRIEQNGAAEADPSYPLTQVGDQGHNCCYLDLGEVVSQGVDTEVSGELMPGLSVFGGYTYNDNENKRSGSLLQTFSPKHMLKLWSSYKLPFAEHRWLVGGGVNVQSRRSGSVWARPFNPDTGLYDGPFVQFSMRQGGYAVWNAMAQYRINPSWDLSLNANNLLDKRYFSGLFYGSRYGEPRNFILSLRGKF